MDHELDVSGSQTISGSGAQDNVVGNTATSQNIDQQDFVQNKAVNREVLDHVEAEPNQEPTIANPLDATSGGNDQVKILVSTSEKGGSGLPSTAKSNNEGSIATKVSKSSSSDKEQKPCKSSGKYSSVRGRSQKQGVQVGGCGSIDDISVARVAVIAAAIVLAVIAATANNTAIVGARREVAVVDKRSTKSNNEGSIATKVSKSSSSDKEQKPCKSSSKYSSSRGRSWKRRSLVGGHGSINNVSAARVAVLAAAIVPAVTAATANGAARVGARREVTVVDMMTTFARGVPTMAGTQDMTMIRIAATTIINIINRLSPRQAGHQCQ
eukprot:CAMPEP_0196825612 /NCGR_PEP_ID=MMETSP1362-20130617/93154_1 /TAXON_ID=163516 /ORGANISM="Leptocylindrus danicus, Strain CCMP1856" /LENGTH=324 /DNA_ID=CAMNT_0042206067 /DNA_START=80 /DNA_END=1054 /DNA_ORIENTATION=-